MDLEVERSGQRTVLRAAGSSVARLFALVFTGASPVFAALALALFADAAGLVELDHTRVTCDRAEDVCAVSGWLGATRHPVARLGGAVAEADADRARVAFVCADCAGQRLPLTGWSRRPPLVDAWRVAAETLDGFLRDRSAPRVEVLLPRSEVHPALAGATLAAAAFFLWVIGKNARLGARSVTVELDATTGALTLRDRGVLFERRRLFRAREVELEVRSYLRELPSRGRMVEVPFLEVALASKGRRFPVVDRAATPATRAAMGGLEAALGEARRAADGSG